jgi:RNA polymerase sigma factor (sigma-70 family)
MDHFPTHTTTTILNRLRTPSDAEAWSAFDARYRPVLRSFTARMFGLSQDQADEAAQETLTRFALALAAGKYERGRGRLRSWMISMARNVALELRRHRAYAPLEPGGDHDPEGPTAQATWDEEQRREVVRQAWRILREGSRFDERTLRCFELTVLHDVPVEAAAAQCAMTADDVYVARTRVRQRLATIEGELRAALDEDA